MAKFDPSRNILPFSQYLHQVVGKAEERSGRERKEREPCLIAREKICFQEKTILRDLGKPPDQKRYGDRADPDQRPAQTRYAHFAVFMERGKKRCCTPIG